MKFRSVKISEKIHLALRWLVYLAQNQHKNPSSLAGFSAKENLSFYFLQKISRLLKKKGLIKAERGARGGYLLAKRPRKISLKEIFEAVEGEISLIDCSDYPTCPLRRCSSRLIWQKLNKQIITLFSRIKLSDIL